VELVADGGPDPDDRKVFQQLGLVHRIDPELYLALVRPRLDHQLVTAGSERSSTISCWSHVADQHFLAESCNTLPPAAIQMWSSCVVRRTASEAGELFRMNIALPTCLRAGGLKMLSSS
jgi:hypothetical protein